jgi:hypothetical protein
MSGNHLGSGLISALAVAAMIVSCGGSDGGDNGDNGAASEPSDTAAPTATARDEATSDETIDDAAADSGSDDATDSRSTTTCDAIFSMTEIEEFFDEPVELTEESNDDVGQLVCNWETIENPDELDDLAIQSLLVQFYSGSPIPGSAFFDPTLYESPTPIDGIGDLAYATGTDGMDYFFVDEPVSGSLNYMTFNLGADDDLPMHTAAEVEQLFRLFHDRVT